jgi:isopenicillin N synthase-like dioxygenase
LSGVPVIDLGRDKETVAAEIGRACEQIGFLTVVGHDVPDETVERMSRLSRTFFDLPAEEKLACAEGAPTRGLPAYRPLESERLAATAGGEAAGDLKESLDWVPAVAGYAWPERPAGLRDAFVDYFGELSRLGARLRRLFALALGLPHDWFEDAFRDHSSSLRAVNYPDPGERVQPGQLRRAPSSAR